jgi:hypothetical protein
MTPRPTSAKSPAQSAASPAGRARAPARSATPAGGVHAEATLTWLSVVRAYHCATR